MIIFIFLSIKPKYDLRLFLDLHELHNNCSSEQFMYQTCTTQANPWQICCLLWIKWLHYSSFWLKNSLYKLEWYIQAF